MIRTPSLAAVALALTVTPAFAQNAEVPSSLASSSAGLPAVIQPNGSVIQPNGSADSQRAELNRLALALEKRADVLTRGLLPIRLGSVRYDALPISGARPAAAGGGGAAGALGGITGALGPIANSFSALTRKDDPMEGNGLSDGLAVAGAVMAVTGGILNVVASSGGGDEMGAADTPPELALKRGYERVREAQLLAAALIPKLETLASEATGIAASERTPDAGAIESLIQRARRVEMQSDFLLSIASEELADLAYELDGAPADDSEAAAIRRAVEVARATLMRAAHETGVTLGASLTRLEEASRG